MPVICEQPEPVELVRPLRLDDSTELDPARLWIRDPLEVGVEDADTLWWDPLI